MLVGFLVVSMAIGLYHSLTGGRQRTVTEFILAGRSLKALPTAVSLCVSFQSAIAMLGMTAELYRYGAQILLLKYFAFVVTMVIVHQLIVPWLYPLKLTSSNEYIFVRFQSRCVKLFTSILGMMAWTLYMGTAIWAPSAALESVTNIPMKLSVPLMSAVCICYTALGGMRAVIWTDVFQFVIMLGGMTAIIIKGFMVVGGVRSAFQYVNNEGRLILADWDPDPTVRHTVWGILIGSAILDVPPFGISQAAVQRYSATGNLAKAKLTVLLSVPGNFLLDTMTGLAAVVVFAYYAMIQCDPLMNKEIYNENQLLPYYVMTLFSDVPGFAGLFMATLYGGALSTVSSALSGASANCWQDIMKDQFSSLPETTKTLINRILVIVFGALAVSVSFLVTILPGPISQIAAALGGSIIGSIFGIFVLGGISRHGNWKGALAGGFVSLFVILWISIGSMTVRDKYPSMPRISVDGCVRDDNVTSILSFTSDNGSAFATAEPRHSAVYRTKWTPNHSGIERLYCFSYCWYMMSALIITVLVGFIVSIIFRDKELEEAVEDKLLIKFGRRNSNTVAATKEEKFDTEKQNMDERSENVELKNTAGLSDRQELSL